MIQTLRGSRRCRGSAVRGDWADWPGPPGPPPGRATSRRGLLARDRGMVTLETAIAIPVLLAALVIVLWGLAVGVAHVRVGDAARSAARAAARGETDQAATAAALRSAPGAAVTVSRTEELVTVAVSLRLDPPVPLLAGLGVTVADDATAALERPEVLP